MRCGTPDATSRLLGPLARRLAPRALPVRGASRRPDAGAPLAFALSAQGLAEAGAALSAIGGARVEPFVTADGPRATQVLYLVPADALARAARHGDEEARLLLDAQAALDLPPPPPRLMGVVNVTPDSFSDGGRWLDADAAVRHGLELRDQGASWLDVGGESTRPGACEVPADEERDRILPVVRRLAEAGATVSIDTRKAAVAEAALDAGAGVVNDVSAGRHDPAMLDLVAERGVPYVAMHMRGDPETMQDAPRYDDPVAEVCEELRERAAAGLKAGIAPDRIVLDPGIGFGKSVRHNLELLRRLPELRSLGLPLCLGVSRKSFIRKVTDAVALETGGDRGGAAHRPDERVGGTAAALAFCVLGGADWLRVHDVAIMSEASAVAWGIARGLDDAGESKP